MKNPNLSKIQHLSVSAIGEYVYVAVSNEKNEIWIRDTWDDGTHEPVGEWKKIYSPKRKEVRKL